MIIPTHFGPASPLSQAQAWSVSAFSRLVSLDLTAVHLRFALAGAVALPLVRAADALARCVMDRAWQGARFAEDITAAATMVAAARR